MPMLVRSFVRITPRSRAKATARSFKDGFGLPSDLTRSARSRSRFRMPPVGSLVGRSGASEAKIAALPDCGYEDLLAKARKRDRVFLARSEEHTSELQSLMRISYAVFCLKKKNKYRNSDNITPIHTSHHVYTNNIAQTY